MFVTDSLKSSGISEMIAISNSTTGQTVTLTKPLSSFKYIYVTAGYGQCGNNPACMFMPTYLFKTYNHTLSNASAPTILYHIQSITEESVYLISGADTHYIKVYGVY